MTYTSSYMYVHTAGIEQAVARGSVEKVVNTNDRNEDAFYSL